jgi:hypothetical protein
VVGFKSATPAPKEVKEAIAAVQVERLPGARFRCMPTRCIRRRRYGVEAAARTTRQSAV